LQATIRMDNPYYREIIACEKTLSGHKPKWRTNDLQLLKEIKLLHADASLIRLQLPPEDIFELFLIWTACTVVTKRHHTINVITLSIYGLGTLCTSSLPMVALVIALISFYLTGADYQNGERKQLYCSHVQRVRGVIVEIERLESLRKARRYEELISRYPILQEISKLKTENMMQQEAKNVQERKKQMALWEERVKATEEV
jgi:hypothetical protein